MKDLGVAEVAKHLGAERHVEIVDFLRVFQEKHSRIQMSYRDTDLDMMPGGLLEREYDITLLTTPAGCPGEYGTDRLQLVRNTGSQNLVIEIFINELKAFLGDGLGRLVPGSERSGGGAQGDGMSASLTVAP